MCARTEGTCEINNLDECSCLSKAPFYEMRQPNDQNNVSHSP